MGKTVYNRAGSQSASSIPDSVPASAANLDLSWVYGLDRPYLMMLAQQFGLGQEGVTPQAVANALGNRPWRVVAGLAEQYSQGKTAYNRVPQNPPGGPTVRVPSAQTMNTAARYEAERRKWLATRSAEEQAGFAAPSRESSPIPVLGMTNRKPRTPSPKPIIGLGMPVAAPEQQALRDAVTLPQKRKK